MKQHWPAAGKRRPRCRSVGRSYCWYWMVRMQVGSLPVRRVATGVIVVEVVVELRPMLASGAVGGESGHDWRDHWCDRCEGFEAAPVLDSHEAGWEQATHTPLRVVASGVTFGTMSGTRV